MINALFLLGKPQEFQGICKVYSPSVNEILDDKNYSVYRKLLTISQEDIEDELAEKGVSFNDLPSPLTYLFELISSDERIKEIAAKGFEFFIHEPVTFLIDLKTIIIGDLTETLSTISSVEELRLINESNFFEFQNLIRQALGEKEAEPYDPNENPKIKYFKAKARLRDRVKAKSADSLNLGSTLAAICCMDLGLNPLNIGELSQSALSVLMRYYQEKTKYDIDIRSIFAGADSKKIQPKNWIRNIEDL